MHFDEDDDFILTLCFFLTFLRLENIVTGSHVLSSDAQLGGVGGRAVSVHLQYHTAGLVIWSCSTTVNLWSLNVASFLEPHLRHDLSYLEGSQHACSSRKEKIFSFGIQPHAVLLWSELWNRINNACLLFFSVATLWLQHSDWPRYVWHGWAQKKVQLWPVKQTIYPFYLLIFCLTVADLLLYWVG